MRRPFLQRSTTQTYIRFHSFSLTVPLEQSSISRIWQGREWDAVLDLQKGLKPWPQGSWWERYLGQWSKKKKKTISFVVLLKLKHFLKRLRGGCSGAVIERREAQALVLKADVDTHGKGNRAITSPREKNTECFKNGWLVKKSQENLLGFKFEYKESCSISPCAACRLTVKRISAFILPQNEALWKIYMEKLYLSFHAHPHLHK